MTNHTIETEIYLQLVHLMTLSDTYHHYMTINQHQSAQCIADEITTYLQVNYDKAQILVETHPSFIIHRYCDLLTKLTLQPLVIIDTGNMNQILNTWQTPIHHLLSFLTTHIIID
ncbi:hypothetical protein ACY2DA_03760 [Staphylococcus simulans]